MRLRPIAVSLLLAVAAASPGALSPRAGAVLSPAVSAQTVSTDRPSRSWRRASSTHFVAIGDAPEAVLREAVSELEIFRSAMFGLAPFIPTPRFRTETPLMILFRSDGAFGPYRPRDERGRRRNNVGGYYVDHPDGAYMVAPANGPRLGLQLTTVLHEYAHDVFHFTLGNSLPVWLDEGLAELCGSVGAAGDGQVTGRYLGRPLDWHIMNLRQQIGMPVADLLTVTRARMRTLPESEVGRFYSKSWMLVHFLLLGREDRQVGDVPAFLAALDAGRRPIDALGDAFRIDAATIDETLARYVLARSFPAVRIDDPGEFGGRNVAIEPVLESEVDVLQGRLLSYVGDTVEAGKRLTSAFARNPQSTAARIALARYRTNEFRADEALDLLGPVIVAEPQSYSARVALGDAQQRAGHLADALATFTTATTLDASPSTGTDAWFGVSTTALSLDRVDEADAAMARLQSIDPSPGWYFGRALDLWDTGQYARAVADVQTLLAMDDSEVDARAYAAFIGALSARRLDQHDVATALLTRADSPELSSWTRTVMTYLRGGHSDREFLVKARGIGQETEAHGYIGVTASLAGRREEALRHLTWVRDRGAHNYTEYAMARTELARLEAAGH